jgi:hypothetical protein
MFFRKYRLHIVLGGVVFVPTDTDIIIIITSTGVGIKKLNVTYGFGGMQLKIQRNLQSK